MRALLANPKQSTGGGAAGRKRKLKKTSAGDEVRSFDEGPDLYLTLTPDQASPCQVGPDSPTFVYNEWKHSPTLDQELGSLTNILEAALEAGKADS